MIDTNLYKQGIWADIPVVNTIHTDFYDTVYTKLNYTTEVKIPFLCDWDEAVIKDDFLNYKKIHMEIEYEFVDTIEVKVPDFINKKGVFRVKCPRYNINKMTVLEL